MTEYNYTNAPIGHRIVSDDDDPNDHFRCSCGLAIHSRDQLAEHHAAVRKRELAAVGAPNVSNADVVAAWDRVRGAAPTVHRCDAWSYPNYPTWVKERELHNEPADGRRCALFAVHPGDHALTGPFNDSRKTASPPRPRVALLSTPFVELRCPRCDQKQPARERDRILSIHLWSRDELVEASKVNEGRRPCANPSCNAVLIVDDGAEVRIA